MQVGDGSSLGGGGDKKLWPNQNDFVSFLPFLSFEKAQIKFGTLLAALGLSETADPVTYTPPEEVRIMFIQL